MILSAVFLSFESNASESLGYMLTKDGSTKVATINVYNEEGLMSLHAIIGEESFENYEAATKITFGKNMTYIGINAFTGCSKLNKNMKNPQTCLYMFMWVFC